VKLARSDSQHGLTPLRALIALLASGLLPLLAYAAAPAWWSDRGVLVTSAAPDDFATANQGQLKNIAVAATNEMDAKLSGGAGAVLHRLVDGWTHSTANVNDYAPVNLGQLRQVSRPFYDRLAAAGLPHIYPWPDSIEARDDFAVASVGQVKNAFSFDVPAQNEVAAPGADRLSAGWRSANLAVDESGAVWVWNGPYSSGGGACPACPRKAIGLYGASAVSAGDQHVAVLRKGGSVWTWGDNGAGQLGDATTTSRTVPARVPTLENLTSVKAGGAHTLALQQDGTLLAWGDNYYGQLGTGDTAGATSPVPVSGIGDVRKIAAGRQRNVALKNDGTVWLWGYDHYAWQTGEDITTMTPTLVSDLTDVVDVAAGYEHVVAVKSDGSVWAWGSNYSNQVANGNFWWQFQTTPFQVPNLANVISVASKFDHTLALLSDGTVWAWGYNASGQLGDGTSEPRRSPVPVTGLRDVIAIATEWSYSMAMKSDGSVWAWGDGAPGVSPGVDAHLPQQVVLGLMDANQNSIDDRWETRYFGNLEQRHDGDWDGDGITNLQEFLRSSDPNDYFNGTPAAIEVVSGDNQLGDPEAMLPAPFVVRVAKSNGQPLANAPVTFSVTQSWGELAPSEASDERSYELQVRTNHAGEASVYYVPPAAAADVSMITATTGPSGSQASVTFTATTTTPPPPSTPEALTVVRRADGGDELTWSAASGNQRSFIIEARMPDGSWITLATVDAATTSYQVAASATATSYRISASNNIQTVASAESSPARVRYAVVDLGTDQTPRVLTNNNAVLLGARQRWQRGHLETLEAGPQGVAPSYMYASDINDDGTTVGEITINSEERTTRLDNEVEGPVKLVQRSVAAKWDTGSITPSLLPAASETYALTPPSGDPYPTLRGTMTYSTATTIDNDGHILGIAMPSGGCQNTIPDWLPNGGKANHWGYFAAGYDWKTGAQLGNLALSLNGNYYTLSGEDRVIRKSRHGTQIGDRHWNFRAYDGWAIWISMNATYQSSVAIVNGDDVNFYPRAVNSKGRVLGSDANGWFGYDPETKRRTYFVGNSPAYYIQAFNGRELSTAPDSAGNALVTDAPQLVGGYGRAACLWEQRAPGGKYDATTLNQLIPADSGWQLEQATDVNDAGVIACIGWYQPPAPARPQRRACLLAPVEIRDTSNNQVVTDVALIKGHSANGDSAPEMPKLEARIVGAPPDWQVEWSLENRYPRRNGKDDLALPPAGGGSGVTLAADQPWKIWEAINNSAGPKFFGGDVAVKYTIRPTSGKNTVGDASFKIRGENPADDRCQQQIIDSQGATWYAWAIAKHESRDSAGVYNQFANGLADGTAGAHGARGEPFYSPAEGNGWGLFQRDEASGVSVTTEETWSWHANMEGFLFKEYPGQLRIANTYVDSVKRNNPATFEEPQFTIKGRSISGRDVLALTWYNGPQGRTNASMLRFDASRPAGSRWSLSLPNAPGKTEPYAHLVIAEYDGG
jgi:alpha-tubulin suppressor-like RCC1 family protein